MAKYRYEERLSVSDDGPDGKKIINDFAEKHREYGFFVRVLETTGRITASATIELTYDEAGKRINND